MSLAYSADPTLSAYYNEDDDDYDDFEEKGENMDDNGDPNAISASSSSALRSRRALNQQQTELQFTVLYGSHSGDPPCYLLECSGCKILLDCGWNDSFDVQLLEPLKKVARSIDVVLITHANLEHIGALPYARKHFGLTAPVFATSPVIKLGHLALYDAVLNLYPSHLLEEFLKTQGNVDKKDKKSKNKKKLNNAEDDAAAAAAILKRSTDFTPRCGYDLDDIDITISTWRELKYLQPLRLTGKGEGIVVTAYNSGRTAGGCVWRIHRDQDDVLYASDINQSKSHHLDGMELKKLSGLRPSLLIADIASAASNVNTPTPQARDAQFSSIMIDCLRRGGDVLLPVDSCGRCLELLIILDSMWRSDRGLRASYALCYVTHISSTLDVAFSHLEWMSGDFSKKFDISKVNPFELPCIHVVDRLEHLPAGLPRVVVCSSSTLEGGFSQELLLRDFIKRPKSLVILTEKPFERRHVEEKDHPSLLKKQLVANQLLEGARVIQFELENWVPLSDSELLEWHEARRIRAVEREKGRERDLALERMQVEQARELRSMNENADRLDASDGNDANTQNIGGNMETPNAPLISGTGGGGGGAGGVGGGEKQSGEDGMMKMDEDVFDMMPSQLDDVRGDMSMNATSQQVYSYVDFSKGKKWDAYGEFINDADYMDLNAPAIDKEDTIKQQNEGTTETQTTSDNAQQSSSSTTTTTTATTSTSTTTNAASSSSDIIMTENEDEYEQKDDDNDILDDDDDDSSLYGGGTNNDDDDVDESDEPPLKRVIETVSVPVQCGVQYVDYGGWADRRSLLQIILSIQPKKLAAVRAQPSVTYQFVSECKRAAACGIALMPIPGECIDIASQSSVLSLRLAEETVVDSFAPVRVSAEWTVQRIRGYLSNGILQPVKSFETSILRDNNILWLSQGEPSLIKLREVLKAKAGIESTFENGVLLCTLNKASVTVYRPPGGRILINGPLCDLYFKVRDVLYESSFTMI